MDFEPHNFPALVTSVIRSDPRLAEPLKEIFAAYARNEDLEEIWFRIDSKFHQPLRLILDDLNEIDDPVSLDQEVQALLLAIDEALTIVEESALESETLVKVKKKAGKSAARKKKAAKKPAAKKKTAKKPAAKKKAIKKPAAKKKAAGKKKAVKKVTAAKKPKTAKKSPAAQKKASKKAGKKAAAPKKKKAGKPLAKKAVKQKAASKKTKPAGKNQK
jgi:septal ring-binding cell division protein DamX